MLELLWQNEFGEFMCFLDQEAVAFVIPLDNRGIWRFLNHLRNRIVTRKGKFQSETIAPT